MKEPAVVRGLGEGDTWLTHFWLNMPVADGVGFPCSRSTFLCIQYIGLAQWYEDASCNILKKTSQELKHYSSSTGKSKVFVRTEFRSEVKRGRALSQKPFLERALRLSWHQLRQSLVDYSFVVLLNPPTFYLSLSLSLISNSPVTKS